MPVYWINIKDKGLSSQQITSLENAADIPGVSLSSYSLAHRAIHIVVFDGHTVDELPKLPAGLSYEESPTF